MTNAVEPTQRTQPTLVARRRLQQRSWNGTWFVAAWVVLSTFCSCAGWLLSAAHALTPAGYAITFVAGPVVVWFFRRRLIPPGMPRWRMARFRCRYRRMFPLAFLVLAAMSILGGALHSPSNYDALAYRVPRILHWLAAGQWHWIYTDFQRVNTRACGIEWLSAPLIAFTNTDRTLFLINACSFLLLPGLVFSVFTRVGVKPRAAWHWMWILPTGYCYLLQAGSIANDMFSTVYALAALDFALRARKSGRVSEAILSVLSAALLTGAKASNLPLLLPWFIAFAPTWRLWLARPVVAAAMLLPAFGASFVPTALLNQVHCGDWSGATAEHFSVGSGPIWLHFLANGVTWSLDNLAPPLFPMASAWNRAADALTPPGLTALFRKYYYEPGSHNWHLPEIQLEELAGLGFGITILLVLTVLVPALSRRQKLGSTSSRSGGLLLRAVCLAPWFSLLFVMAKLSLSAAVRYLAPYYPLLCMGLLQNRGAASVTRRGWWRSCALFSFGLAALITILSPARPLWPAKFFFERYASRLESSRLGMRARDAYTAKTRRADIFAPVVASLPPDAQVLGYAADDLPETSLWKPFGSRRVLHVKLTDSREAMQQRGIKYVLLLGDKLTEPFPEWLKQRGARNLQTLPLKVYGSFPPFVFHLVELSSPADSQSAPDRSR